KVDSEKFQNYLKLHQKGNTNYFTFCEHCAQTGIEKWVMDLGKMTCTYYDPRGNMVLQENIPQ
ncbi:MAG: phage envelope protein, partial [Pseudopedobacter saltans]